MICIIALLVFGILSIFSAKYRPLAAEAFDCTFRKLTLRKCETGLDQRIKAQVTGSLMSMNQGIAGFVFKHFETISILFTLLFFASLAYSVYGAYNFIKYGDCYGPVTTPSSGLCIYNALAGEQTSGSGVGYNETIVFPTVGNNPSIGPIDAKVTIIEFGCLMCPYTKKAEPTVKELLKRYDGQILYVYRNFPLQQHPESALHAEAANCAADQGKYWEYRDRVFQMQDTCRNSIDHLGIIKNVITELGLNKTVFDECLESGKYKLEVEQDLQDGINAGITGTPTFFINNRTIVGPKPIDAFIAVIDEELKK